MYIGNGTYVTELRQETSSTAAKTKQTSSANKKEHNTTSALFLPSFMPTQA